MTNLSLARVAFRRWCPEEWTMTALILVAASDPVVNAVAELRKWFSAQVQHTQGCWYLFIPELLLFNGGLFLGMQINGVYRLIGDDLATDGCEKPFIADCAFAAKRRQAA
jgi:hypothetical protein